MRPTTPFLLLPLLIGMALSAALMAVTARPASAQWTTGDQPPDARQNEVTVTLAITSATPTVNQPVNVTVTLTNLTAGATVSDVISRPLYTLQVEPPGETPILLPDRSQTRRDVILAPGESDAARFALYPVSGGRITLTAQVTATVRLSSGTQTQMGWRAQPVTVTVPAPSLAASVIYETAANSACATGPDLSIAAGADWGAFSCAYAPGHSFSTRLDETNSPTAVMVAFNAARGDHPLGPFHCHLAYAWSERPGGGPITDSGHGWTAGRWVNISEAADDTPYGGAAAASESVYRTLSRRGLIEPCMSTYLPVAGR